MSSPTTALEPPSPISTAGAYRFGPKQGAILVIGMMLMSALGSLLVGFAWGFHLSSAHPEVHSKLAHGLIKHLSAIAPAWVVATSALSGSLLAAVWVFGYALYAARPILCTGGNYGVGWKRANRTSGYGVAVILSFVALCAVFLSTILYPPDPKHLTGPVEQLGRLPGLSHLAFILIAVFIAPVVEELAFRGMLLASLARRYGIPIAVTATTAIFVALHAPDKIHYWPGFIDVGILALFAAYVRLKYDSIRPSILLHFLYNGSLVFLATFFH